MANEVGSAYVTIGARTEGLRAGMSEAKSSLDGFKKGLREFGIELSASTLLIGGFKKGLDFIIGSASDAQISETKLNALVKATGIITTERGKGIYYDTY